MVKPLLLIRCVVGLAFAWIVFLPPSFLNPLANQWYRAVVRIVGHGFDLFGIFHLPGPTEFAVGAADLPLAAILGPLSSPLLLVGLVWVYAWLRRLPWRARLRLLVTSALIGLLQPIVTTFLAGYAAQTWQWDCASWTERSLLNLCGLIVGLVLVFCTDMLTWFVVSPMIVDPQEVMPITVWWNRAVSGLPRDPNLVGKDGKIRVPKNESRLVMFLHHWSKTRSWWALVAGLPVVALAVALVACYFSTPSDLAIRYQRATQASAEQLSGIEDAVEATIISRAANTLSERLLRLDPSNVVANTVQADLAEGRGDLEAARTLLRGIAPAESGGDLEAHWRLAKDLLQNSTDPVLAREAVQHLQHATRSDSHRVEAHQLLAHIFQQSQQYPRAAEHLMQIIDERPNLLFALAESVSRSGDPQEAHKYWVRARDHFRSLTEVESPQADDYLQWLHAENGLKNYDAVEPIVEQAKARVPDPRYDHVLSFTYSMQADQLAESSPQNAPEALKLMHKALLVAPRQRSAIRGLYSLAVRFPQAESQVIDWLSEVVSSPDSDSAEARFVLGNIATLHSEFAVAARHYERALELNPERVELINNLAWSLGHTDPPQLERALKLSREALERDSSNPEYVKEFYVTHGLLLIKAGRYAEGITNLERTLPDVVDRPHVHEGLATAYEALGYTEIAEAHRVFVRSSAGLNAE